MGEQKTLNMHSIPSNEKEIILRRGAVLSIKHPTIFEPVLNVIQKVEGENIYFRLPEFFLKNNVLKGDNIICQILSDEYEYVLEGFISDIDIHYPRYVQFCVDKIEKFKNLRVMKRYLVSFQANIIMPGTEKKIYSIVKNISTSGIGCVFKENINAETLVNVTVAASISKTDILQFKAKVIRAMPRSSYNEYGLLITDIDEKNKDMLDRLIYKLQEDETFFVSDSLK